MNPENPVSSFVKLAITLDVLVFGVIIPIISYGIFNLAIDIAIGIIGTAVFVAVATVLVYLFRSKPEDKDPGEDPANP